MVRTRSVGLLLKASFRTAYLREARRLAGRLEKERAPDFPRDRAEIEDLKYFHYIHSA